ncbi:MAG: DNA polymerase domain-containing protein [Candidatus Bathyarchaeum tardum]|nr:MAG: DNA polymerase domain-containing protein [Candidatus Bathyarchaeum tardum]
MVQQNPVLNKVKGWLFDLYPSTDGQMNVWIICENGKRIKLVDTFKPRFYVSSKEASLNELQNLVSKLPIDSSRFVPKHVDHTNWAESLVQEVTVTNYQKIPLLVRKILEAGKYLRYQVHNSDLSPSQLYMFERDLFPLAFVEINVENYNLNYKVLDSVEAVNYAVPPFRFAELHLSSNQKHKPSTFNEPIEEIAVAFDNGQKVVINSGTERYKLLHTAYLIRNFDPDIIFTNGGDSFIFPYLAKRATVNEISNNFVLSRDKIPLVAKPKKGTTYFSYGQTYFRSPTRRLYGRIHVDENNTFVVRESGFNGLIEIARSCRVPLHKASRSSIGTTMSALQNYQALKDGFLVPRNKQVGESFKSAYQLLIGDRGGFVYEPKIGIHDQVGEIDFSSMYPSLMANYNISAETVLCSCCSDSGSRFPELGFHVCEQRRGIVPKVLEFTVKKRLLYKKLAKETNDEVLREVYDKRQSALKWILVTCFGYLGYRNSKFGTVDGHMGVCAYGRDSLLTASHIAEDSGFNVIHGIVDSLWLKKENTSSKDYMQLAEKISKKVDLPLDFSGLYKWIVFLPSKTHPDVPVLNRYYGVKTDGIIKVRGIQARRRDTPKFVYNAQVDMIQALSSAESSQEFIKKIPDALKVIIAYKNKLLNNEIPIWDLIITKRLSKEPSDYSQNISQRIAGKQLLTEGYDVYAGKSIKYLFTDATNKRHLRRIKPKELINSKTRPDLTKYLSLLYSAASNLLSQFGFSTQTISDYASGFCTPNFETFPLKKSV